MTAPRKVSKFQFCDRHAPWFAGLPRYRKLECMVEGGPGGWAPGCEGGKCRLWPGTDMFVESYCHEEATDLDWTIDDEQAEWERRANVEIGGVA